MRLLLLSILLLARSASPASAQTGSTETPPPTFPHDRGHVTLQAGLIQPALFRGGNVAASYKRGRLVADYSHGFNLDFNANGDVGLRGDQRDQNLDIDVPWTTGFGVGYRITPRLDVRLEGKAHRYEIDPPADAPFAYTTFTVGPGVYYELPVWRRLTVGKRWIAPRVGYGSSHKPGPSHVAPPTVRPRCPRRDRPRRPSGLPEAESLYADARRTRPCLR